MLEEAKQHSGHCAVHSVRWAEKTWRTADGDMQYGIEPAVTRVVPSLRSSGNGKLCSDSWSGLSRTSKPSLGSGLL